jgi:hypothetical protein
MGISGKGCHGFSVGYENGVSRAIVHLDPKKSRGARAIVAGDPALQTIDRSNGRRGNRLQHKGICALV